MKLTEKELFQLESILDNYCTAQPQDSQASALWWKFFEFTNNRKKHNNGVFLTDIINQ